VDREVLRVKALVQSAFGSAHEVLSITEVEQPSIGSTDVLVQVRAVGIAKGIWLMTHGLPYIARPSYGIRTPKQRVAGLQFAGIVAAVGDAVDQYEKGDAVFGFGAGSLATFVAVPADSIAAKPENVGFEQAAAAPISGITALQAVRDGGRVRANHRVLVLGASGGVGSFAVQLAKAYGAVVTAVASGKHLAMVRELGADHAVDYTREDPIAGDPAYDVIIDIAGNRPVSRLRKALTPDGALVIVGGTGSRWTMGFERTIGAMLRAPFVRQRITGLLSQPNRRDLGELAEMMASGRLTCAVRSSYPLSRAAEVIEAVGAGTGGPGTPVIAV
jgi:NADPH:quinone reductase-like Zn-dependent oxidoreductase